MMVKLVRLTLKSDPDTILPISSELGSVFEVVGYDREMVMVDRINKKHKTVSVYHIVTDVGIQIAPCDLFEAILDQN